MTVDDRLFEGALGLLSELTDEGRVFVNLRPPFSVTFDVNREVLSDRLEGADIDRPDFNRASSEIADLVLAALQGRTREFVDAYSAHLEESEREATRALTEARIAKVNALVDERLRQRYALKVNSKAPAFASLEWDVKRKVYDRDHGDMACSYATLKLSHQRDFSLGPETFFARNVFESVSINMTTEELQYLVQELSQALKKLQAAEAGDIQESARS